MRVTYDFDIRWIVPRDQETDPAIGQLLSDIGIKTNTRGNYIALFRDPAVLEMIERADPVLREFLKACGFGFVPSDSGLPAGVYPEEDEGALNDVLQRLHDNFAVCPLEGANLGGFDFGALVTGITSAQALPSGAADPRAASKNSGLPMPEPELQGTGRGTWAKSAGRSRAGTFAFNLFGLLVVAYVAVKLFASPTAF